jgi:YfiR/HmsC-like
MFTAKEKPRVSTRANAWGAAPRTFWIFPVLLMFVPSFPAGLRADSAISKEYQVKAAFLYNFTKFVEWPAQRLPTTEKPIVIGIFGSNPFGGELEKLVQNRKVNGHGFTVVGVTAASDLASIHLLFVPLGEEARLGKQTMAQVEAAGILTVGESDQFTALGGVITFVTEVDKVRFRIDQEATARAGIKISAQLLNLAVPSRKKEER